ncbi:DNA cytosine methyltransferase, partial [Ruthenibacterium lactatiformans]
MQKLRLGSLFDGIGGFPLAAAVCGMEPVWASEIETFPIEVTRLRFPGMLHVGDITKLRGAELPPVDIVCGGSPCQDLSIAGLRAGLAGARSGLFMEQLRVIREMRDADRARGRTALAVRPRYMLWENVPGAFSSYDGEDFRAVLEETARVAEPDVSIPRPEAGPWKSAGHVLGGNFSIAWAVYDAEFFGVAQRRRRIFLVADLAGHSAAEILFEREGLPGYIAAKRRTWEDIAAAAGIRRADAGGAEGGAGTRALTAYAANGRDEVRPMYGTAATITAHPGLRQETILLEREVCLNDQGGMRMGVSEGVSGTLRADMGGHPPIVLGSEQGGAEVAFDLCPTLTASAGMSGNNRPVLF